MTWGAVAAGVIGAGASIYSANQNANAASDAAAGAQFRPYNTGGLLGNSFINPETGQLQFSANNDQGFNFNGLALRGVQNANAASGLFSNLLGTGGLDNNVLGLQNQYNQSTQANDALLNDPTQRAFSALGSFDPTAAGNQFTANLDSANAQGNQNAAQGLAQRLFNTGSLGTTGGQGLFGQLIQAQNQQHLQNQIAGQQLGQQQQANLLGQALNLNNSVNQRADQRLTSQLGLLGFGQDNLSNLSNFSNNQLGQSLGINSALQSQATLGIQAGSAQAAAGANAAQIGLPGQIAANNTFNSMFQNLLGSAQTAYNNYHQPPPSYTPAPVAYSAPQMQNIPIDSSIYDVPTNINYGN